MAQYLVAIHHPDGYDGSLEGEEMGRDIDALNEEMVAAGVRVYVNGLRPAKGGEVAKSAARRQGARHRRAVSRDQGAHRRFLGLGSRRYG